MSQVTFRAGDLLFQEGDPSNHAFLLESGSVEILRGYPEAPRTLGMISAGEVFGEMGLIDERPRRGTARAVTDGQVTKLTREEFSSLLLSDPQRCLRYLRSLFERLRQLEAQLHPSTESDASREGKTTGKFELRLFPLSRHTAGILDPEGLAISTFPFRIGRANEARESQPLDLNDLWLLDKSPFSVSRNHAVFDLIDGNRYIVRDRGSHLGTIVNQKPIGGKSLIREAELEEGDNVIVLGGRSSPFQFRAVLQRVSK